MSFFIFYCSIDFSEVALLSLCLYLFDWRRLWSFQGRSAHRIDITEEVWVNEFELEDEALFGPSDNIIDENDTEEDDIDLYGLVFNFFFSLFSFICLISGYFIKDCNEIQL